MIRLTVNQAPPLYSKVCKRQNDLLVVIILPIYYTRYEKLAGGVCLCRKAVRYPLGN